MKASQQDKPRKDNGITTMIHLLKAFIGLEILEYPAAFSSIGWAGGLIFFLLCGVATMYLSIQLIHAAEKKNSNAKSISEFSIQTLGPKSSIWIYLFLIVFQLSICVAFAMFASSTFRSSICFFTGNDLLNPLCGSRVPSLIICFILILPAIFVRTVSQLKHWNFFSNFLIAIAISAVLGLCFSLMTLKTITSDQVENFKWNSFGEAIGLFLFTFKGVTLYFEIRSSMEEPKDFVPLLKSTFVTTIGLHAVVGIAGYLTFGNSINERVLLTYPLFMIPLVSYVEDKIVDKLKGQHTYSAVNQNEEENKNQSKVEENPNSIPQQQVQEGEQQIQEREVQNNPLEGNQGSLLEHEHEDHEQGEHQQHQHEHQNEHQQSNLEERNPEVNQQNEQNEQNEQGELNQLDDTGKKQFSLESAFLRLCCISAVFSIALVFTQLSQFLGFVGLICGLFYCFVLPVLVYEKAVPEASEETIYFHRGIMSCTIILSVYGIIQTLVKLFS